MASSNRSKHRLSEFHDFYEVLENIAWIWRIIGIFPIAIESKNYTKRYETSKLYAAIGFLTYLMMIVDLMYLMATFNRDFRYPLLLTSTVFTRAISSLLCLSYSNVWRIIKFKELAKLVNDLSTQDRILAKSKCRIDYDSSSKMIRIYVWSTFLVMIYFVTWDVCLTYKNVGFQIEWFIWLLPMFIQVMDMTILVSLVAWLGLEYRSINNKINDVVARANTSIPKTIVTSNIDTENLRILSKFHNDLCKIGKRINRWYYAPVIINVTTAFIILSTSLYFLFDEIQYGNRMSMMLFFSYIHVELGYSLPIIITVIICNWTSSQAMYTGELIHEIRTADVNSRLYDVIKSFSLQLHHQKLEFSGGGLFPLNSSLLQTMAGKITTYLVILIQFQPKLDWYRAEDR